MPPTIDSNGNVRATPTRRTTPRGGAVAAGRTRPTTARSGAAAAGRRRTAPTPERIDRQMVDVGGPSRQDPEVVRMQRLARTSGASSNSSAPARIDRSNGVNYNETRNSNSSAPAEIDRRNGVAYDETNGDAVPSETQAPAQNNAPTEQAQANTGEGVLGKNDENNPYEDRNATNVTVTPWDGLEGNPNDSLSSILLDQGYTLDEILKEDENGNTLIDDVAKANDIANPNLIHPGDELVVPTTRESAGEIRSREQSEALAERRANGETSQEIVQEYIDEGIADRQRQDREALSQERADALAERRANGETSQEIVQEYIDEGIAEQRRRDESSARAEALAERRANGETSQEIVQEYIDAGIAERRSQDQADALAERRANGQSSQEIVQEYIDAGIRDRQRQDQADALAERRANGETSQSIVQEYIDAAKPAESSSTGVPSYNDYYQARYVERSFDGSYSDFIWKKPLGLS